MAAGEIKIKNQSRAVMDSRDWREVAGPASSILVDETNLLVLPEGTTHPERVELILAFFHGKDARRE